MTSAHHTPEQLLARFDALSLDVKTLTHAAVYTVEESKAVRAELAAVASVEGGHCKNLFLKDKKGVLWLVVCDEDRAIDLKALRHQIGAAHLSFGKPELLFEVLGVEPGSVTPFAAINDTERRVNVVIDAALMGHAALHFHPLINTMTTRITPKDLIAFLDTEHGAPLIADLDG